MDKVRRKLSFGDKYVLPTITFLSGIAISAVAVWYSVAGLVAIFAASAFAITVMGIALEVGKLVTAVWLHRYWEYANKWLKYYLSAGVIILMFITSMGIFGFLSKAHIEQTSMSQEQVALIQTLESKENRSQAKIDRWAEEVDRLMKGQDVRVDNLIIREQTALKELYVQIEREKDSARADADKQIRQQNERLAQAQERKKADLKSAGDNPELIEKANSKEIGVAAASQREIRNINRRLNTKISEIDTNYKPNIDTINTRIQKLRSQANLKTNDIDSRLSELESFIDKEQLIVDESREERAVYEKEYRKLEAEVGPIKYVAEFLYGSIEDKNVLESAVRWVIIIIIFVFDPLAVGLLIASQMAFGFGTPQERQEGPWKPKPPPPPAPKPKKKKPEPEPEPQPEPEPDPPKPKKKKKKVVRRKPKLESAEETTTGINYDFQVEKEVGSSTKGKPKKVLKRKPAVKKEPEKTKNKVVKFTKPKQAEVLYTPEDFNPTSKVFEFKSNKPGKVETTDKEITIMPDNEEPIKIPIRKVKKKPAPKKKLAPKNKDNVVKLPTKPTPKLVEETPWQRPSYTDVIEKPTLQPKPKIEKPKPIVSEPKQMTIAEHVESYTEETPEQIEYKENQKRVWKAIHPEETVKPHKIKKKAGYINELPWEQLVLPTADDLPDLKGRSDFGTKFPSKPSKGDTFLRVDNLPHTLYKWNSKKWITVDKTQNSSYAINNQYLEHLIAQISNGEYDPDLLSDKERDELTEYLQKQQAGKNAGN